MKQSVNLYQFKDAFNSLRPHNFSCKGLEALYAYLEALESDLQEEIEFNAIAVCCEFQELSLGDINEYYEENFKNLEEAENYLSEHTQVIQVYGLDPTLIIQEF